MNLAELFVKVSADISGLEKGMTAAQRSVANLGRAMDRVGKTLTIGVTAPLAALGGLSIKAAADFDSLSRGLEAVAGSAGAAQVQLARLREIAKLPAVDLQQAAKASIAFQSIGRDAAFAERTIKAVANAIALSGGGTTEFEGVMRQLRQVAGLGRLMGEELNVIVENAPAMAKALQTAFGTTSAEAIRELGLTSEEFFERFLQGMETLPKVAGGAANAFDNLRQSLQQAAAVIGGQLLPAVLPMVEGFAAWLDSLQQLDPEMIRLGIAAASVAGIMGPLLVVVGQLTTAVTLLSTALKVGLAPVLGVGGIVIVGLTLLSGWFIKNKLDAAAARGEVEKYQSSLSGLSQGLARMKLGDALARQQSLREQLEAPPSSEGRSGFARRDRALGEAEQERLRAELDRTNEEIRILVRIISGGSSSASSALDDLGTAATELSAKMRDLVDEQTKISLRLQEALRPQRLTSPGAEMLRRQQMLGLNTGGLNLGAVTPRSTPLDITAGAGGAPGFLAQTFGALKAQITGLVASFGPLAAAAAVLKPVFEGLLEAIGPALSKLAEPLAQIGRIIGGILVPVLEVLEEPLQILANLIALLLEPLRASVSVIVTALEPGLRLLAGVLKVVTTIFSYLMEGLGLFIRGIGSIIDKLLGWATDAGDRLEEFGWQMIENAKAARKGTLAMEKGAKAVDKLTSSLTNYANIVHINALRFDLQRGMGGSGFAGGAGGSGWRPFTPPMNVTVNVPADVIVEQAGREVSRVRARGGTTRLVAAR